MQFHSDDEKGLGPVVASLSLGSLAHMHFREHKTQTITNPEHQFSLVLRHVGIHYAHETSVKTKQYVG